MYRVLLVDDEPFITEGLETILEWNDYGLTITGTAENGQDAWTLVQHEQVDLIITDIMMPQMTGIELIDHVKKLHPHTRFIILSGYDDFKYVKEGIKLGVENYLLKPINLEEFRSTVETTVQKLNLTHARRLEEELNHDILRHNVLNRWLQDQIDLEELQQRARLLDICFEHPYYWVVLIRSVEHSETEEFMPIEQERLVSRAKQLTDLHEEAYCVQAWNSEIVLVYGLRNPTRDKVIIMEQLRVWKNEFKATHASTLQITMGSIVDGYSKVSLSYDHAKQMQPYHLIRVGEEWVDYEEYCQYRLSRPQSLQPKTDVYVKLLYSKDIAVLDAALNVDFERLSCIEGLEPRDIRTFTLELLMALKKSVKDEFVHASQESRDWFDAVYRLTSIQALKEHVRDVAFQMIEIMSQPEDMPPIVRQVLNHIDKHYAEELSLKTLSQIYNMSPVYLGQLFQKEVGCTFSDYLNKLRISMAKKLLLETSAVMSEIAVQVGYWDKSYFYKQFKKYVGISPKEFREMNHRK